jgi:malate dehydrogenase
VHAWLLARRGVVSCEDLAAQMNPYVSHLSLYDVVGTPGVAADISHINSKAQVKVS